MNRESVLVKTMVELADSLVDDFDIVELLTTLTERCVEVLDIAASGIMLAAPEGELRAMTSSNEAMRVVELFELQSQEGPCLDCFLSGRPVVNQDLAALNGRWPHFAPVAVAAGFLAADAIPMRLRGTVIGALNLFRTEAGSLNDDDVAVAQALADVATIAILQHRNASDLDVVNAQLRTALDSRIIIEQAKGMIAARHALADGSSIQPPPVPRSQPQPAPGRPRQQCRQRHPRPRHDGGTPSLRTGVGAPSSAVTTSGHAGSKESSTKRSGAPQQRMAERGSPIETNDGWLVLTHGVGPMRTYSIGALNLHLDRPTRVIGRTDSDC